MILLPTPGVVVLALTRKAPGHPDTVTDSQPSLEGTLARLHFCTCLVCVLRTFPPPCGRGCGCYFLIIKLLPGRGVVTYLQVPVAALTNTRSSLPFALFDRPSCLEKLTTCHQPLVPTFFLFMCLFMFGEPNRSRPDYLRPPSASPSPSPQHSSPLLTPPHPSSFFPKAAHRSSTGHPFYAHSVCHCHTPQLLTVCFDLDICHFQSLDGFLLPGLVSSPPPPYVLLHHFL